MPSNPHPKTLNSSKEEYDLQSIRPFILQHKFNHANYNFCDITMETLPGSQFFLKKNYLCSPFSFKKISTLIVPMIRKGLCKRWDAKSGMVMYGPNKSLSSGGLATNAWICMVVRINQCDVKSLGC